MKRFVVYGLLVLAVIIAGAATMEARLKPGTYAHFTTPLGKFTVLLFEQDALALPTCRLPLPYLATIIQLAAIYHLLFRTNSSRSFDSSQVSSRHRFRSIPCRATPSTAQVESSRRANFTARDPSLSTERS